LVFFYFTPRKLEERSILFEAFLGAYEVVRVEMFDRHTEEGNQEGLVINRNEELKTFSITS
jgi:hypothetical protein